ncbi:uncharacterized protein PRCAT00002759001 [Priceomyces carsonii]|uniref:uncharacterized protein n=1 Tax=Priceomyces carsonii TaxID=28549 RepID=UPI002ED8A3DE|nr:unnamed protein product [Priceomyces carsonii]
MSSTFSGRTADRSPGDGLEELIDLIIGKQNDLLGLVQLIKKEYTLEELSERLNVLQEYFNEQLGTLSLCQLKDHSVLWVYTLESLSSQILNYKTTFDISLSLCDEEQATEKTNLIGNIAARLGKLFTDMYYNINQFLAKESQNISKYLSSSILLETLLTFLIKSLDTIIIDKPEEMLYLEDSKSTVILMSEFIQGFYTALSSCDESWRNQGLFLSFPMLSRFVNAIYKCALSYLLIPLLKPQKGFHDPIVNPKFAIEAVKSFSVDYNDVINYFKYVAFNLVTLSLGDNVTISDFYNEAADTYFVVLLNLPNIKVEQHPFTFASYRDEEINTSTERKELSMLYLINYLLKLNDIGQIINPCDNFISELKLLTNSLSKDLTSEMTNLTRRGSSFSSERSRSESESDLSEKRQNSTACLVSLSSILLDGTYKEKLIMLVHFFDLFKNEIKISKILKKLYDNNAMTTFQHMVSMIDPKKYPGKCLFANAINFISKLLFVLSIKFLAFNGGLNNVSEVQLNEMFATNCSVIDALKVKHVLDYKAEIGPDGDLVFNFISLKPSHDKTLDIRQQIYISQTTKEVREIIHKLA